MSTIVVQAFITLDGVVQASGGPDEDHEGYFEHAGWATEYDAEYGAEEINEIVGERESKTEALLLGRTTYEIFAGSWGVWDENAEGLDGELTRRYNRIPKYVASQQRPQCVHLPHPRPNHALMRPSCDLDMFGDLAVAGDPAVMRPIQPDDLGQQMRIRGIRLRPRRGVPFPIPGHLQRVNRKHHIASR